MINSVFLRFVSILFLWCITFTDAKKESLNRVSLASPFTGRSRCSRSPRKDGSCRPSGSTRKTRNRRSSRTPRISGQFSLSVIFGFIQTATKQIHCVCVCVTLVVWCVAVHSLGVLIIVFQGGQGLPGAAGEKGPPGPLVRANTKFALDAPSRCTLLLLPSLILHLSSSRLSSCFRPLLFFLCFSSCRDRLVCPACVETPEPRERRVTKVLSVSSDLRESRERRETEAFLGLRDPLDPKERP